MLTFQQTINKLIDFWAKQGCVIQQGYDIEVGAGTFNPSTFLRCLGPEPFNTVYVEPSRRPQDGRFGENPNRTQLFHQLQVIMKPSPLNIQTIYLQSLEAIDICLQEHDIRFVHDDWESPTLGAWGLGWEVWLDGMEVTQFTYFQSIAGLTLEPISVELTYGLERLCMMVQNRANFFSMQYNEHLSYGELYQPNEIEWSHYNFHKATTKMWSRHFEDFECEAQMMLQFNLPIPAYDFVMKASHAFNMLEARGILSVTERTSYIARIRNLAKLVASQYLQSREKLGFPLLKTQEAPPLNTTPLTLPDTLNLQDKDDFLLEIGSEELPASFVPIGCQNLKNAMTKLLKHLSYDSLTTFGTPRRLSLIVKGLVYGKEGVTSRRRGPAMSIAFDTQDNITKQGMGFFKSLGIDTPCTVKEIKQSKLCFVQTIKGEDYLMTNIEEEKISTLHLLSHNLPQLIANLNFPQKMRWSTIHTSYARPLKWFVALFGSHIIPFELAGISSGRRSWGHAQLNNHPFDIEKPSDYVATCLEKHVMVSIEDRKKSIEEALSRIEKETNTTALERERVLSQVLFLSEWPELTYGSFDKGFLDAPKELLISEMVQHQKYFPLLSSNGMIAPLFVITADNKPNSMIKMGNQHVLSARLADGLFLFHQDLQTSLDDFGKRLKTIIFQKDLGTMAEKSLRIKQLAIIFSDNLKLGSRKKISRAAELCKADLTTALVQEFPGLQGTIGKYYALHQKEEKEVALAIEEHWLPKHEGGALPSSSTGIILSLADKLDNLISHFHVGLIPTSSADPYALRRQALGIIKILIAHKLNIDLSPLITQTALAEFIIARVKGIFEECGFRKDEIEASLQEKCINPYDQHLKIKALHTFRQSQYFADLFEVYKRAKGQIGKERPYPLNPHLLTKPSEKNLYNTLFSLHKPFKTSLAQKKYQSAFSYLATLQTPLAALFTEVQILCDEPHIRSNRIALLQKICSYFSALIDFEKIQNI